MVIKEKKQFEGDLRLRQPEKATMRPFVKWAGGKNQLLAEIHNRYPKELGKKIDKYAEPFVGGGAVLFDILNSFDLNSVYISDINKELISTYKTIRDSPGELIDVLMELEQTYLPLENSEREQLFYLKRIRFNELKHCPIPDPIESSSLFIFLNKTCFNGLYRVNKNGDYNVPWGRYKTPKICDKTNLKAMSRGLSNVEIVCGDYKESLSFIDEKTFVYFDPPYRPINNTSHFNSYTDDLFTDKNQKELADYVNTLARRGAKVMVSNSDPKNYSDDEFFDEIYSGLRIERILASRNINSNGEKRGKINELLITNY